MSVRFLVRLATVASTCWFGISSALAENRIALVIGNSHYRSVAELPNPAHDASAVAAFLSSAGFQVVQAPNLTQSEMRRTIGTFASMVSEKGPDTVALVYYAGHGLQVDGENFLVPVDAQIDREGDVPLQAMRLTDLMKALGSVPSKSRIVILDACRNNPFSAINKTSGRGLAIVDAPNGSLVAYSTAPGTEAFDGNGEHSPYTSAFLGIGREVGLPIEQLLKRVRLEVSSATNREQFPWESSSLTAEFSFFPTATAPEQIVAGNNGAITSTEARSRPRSVDSWRKELRSRPAREAYDMVVLDDTVDAYQAYLDLYPWDVLAQTVWNLLDRRNLMLAWHKAVTTHTAASYQDFLASHPHSDFAASATRLVAKLGPATKLAGAGEFKMNGGQNHLELHSIGEKSITHVSSHATNSFATPGERSAKKVKSQNATANENKAWKTTMARAQSFTPPAHAGGMEMTHMSAGHMGGGRH